jgi:dipeptidyl aminopeptidase/acylaminoacyl peptidase
MPRCRIVVIVALLSSVVLAVAAHGAPIPITRIMADPDWIGPPVERAFWSLDGKAVLYRLKRSGSPIRDLHRITLADGRDAAVEPAALAGVDEAGAVFDHARRRAAFVRNGDVFLRDLRTGRLTQVTRTAAGESGPQFSSDDTAVQFHVGTDWFSYDIASAVMAPAAILKLEQDPDAKQPSDLERLQLRLLSNLRRDHDDKKALDAHNAELQSADPTRAPRPVYLGTDVVLSEAWLSPSGRWMVLSTSPKGYDAGRVGKMPRWVTESGYEEADDERTRVGRNEPAPQTLWLVDLAARTATKLAYDSLPGIHDDPLAAIRAENDSARAVWKEPAPKPDSSRGEGGGRGHKSDDHERTMRVDDCTFASDGSVALVRLQSNDNKDRWLVSVEPKTHTLTTQHRLHDPAWINWSFNDAGWLPASHTIWYLSEESGYSHLYRKAIDGAAVALTSGRFEVSQPALTGDGRTFVMRTNAEAPYAYDVYRVGVDGGPLQRVTNLKGVERFAVSPDGRSVLLDHSTSFMPNQAAVVPLAGGEVRELTDTRTAEYKAIPWTPPQIVAVPSSHGAGAIWAKFYDAAPGTGATHPVVLFVHGAGYTQNVHLHYPGYFREQMFEERLSQLGYVVLDMDYRASEGYGRDWRTSIYRQMGTPELEDLIDGVQWAVREHHGDPKRVGLFGGSYGGFMTLMALFKAPEVFQAGAALRPVTDWMQYNHVYTSDILNSPQVDPIAYRRSSPLEFADGLQGSLLICHGMIDDNVFFEDSVRLFQRLMELHKDGVEFAPYPMERHGFVHADSWLDEYKRIERLFETHIGGSR